MVGTPRVTASDIINDAASTIHQRRVAAPIANPCLVDPVIDPVLRQPEVPMAEGACGDGIAEDDNAFARQAGVIVENLWKHGLCTGRQIHGLDQEGDDGAGGLPRYRRRIDAIAGQGVPGKAVVVHQDGRIGRTRVNLRVHAIEQPGLETVRAMETRRDLDRLVGCGNGGRVFHIENGGLLGMPGVPRLAGIGRAPVSSIQLPRTRSKTYGVPRSQRPVSFKVAVEPEPSELAVSADSTSLSPVHMPSLERRWRDCALW